MIISLDLGNKQVNPIHSTFVSSVAESDTKPPFGDEILRYNDKYYTLSSKRIPYTRRKFKDERFSF